MNYSVRRFKLGDEKDICKVIKKDILTENIYDYTKEQIKHLVDEQTEELIISRSKMFHVYTFLDNDKIIGVGMIGPYWDSLTESSFFTIFRDPNYNGKGLGRKIIETLEQDEYYIRANRVEIPASITAVEFYKHMGFGFKETDNILGHIVNEEGQYKLEKFPKVSNNNVDRNQYNIRPYIDNEYHNFKKFISSLTNEDIDYIKDDIWIIQLNGKNIGFYNAKSFDDNYEIQNICILDEYKDIELQVLNDITRIYQDKNVYMKEKNKKIKR